MSSRDMAHGRRVAKRVRTDVRGMARRNKAAERMAADRAFARTLMAAQLGYDG